MIYNNLYNLLVRARDNNDLSSLAASLNVSRDTLRRQLESLDEGLAASLYVRLDSEKVELSDVGLAYANACEKINRLVIDADLKAEKVRRERENTILIGTVSRTADACLKGRTDYRLKTRFFDSSSVQAAGRLSLIGRDFDVALGIYDESWLRKLHLKALELSDSVLAVASGAENPLCRRRKIDIEDLYERKLYVPQHGLFKKIDVLVNDLRDFHPRIEIVQRESISSALCELVSASGDYILVSPEQDLSGKGLRTVGVEWNYRVSYGLIYSTRSGGKVLDYISRLEEELKRAAE